MAGHHDLSLWSICFGLRLKAGEEAVCEALWQMITLGLGANNGAQFGVEFKGTLAIGACGEVGHDLFNPGVRQLRIKEQFQFFQCFLAIWHIDGSARSGDYSPVPSTVSGSTMSPRSRAYSYNIFCIAFLPRCSRDITVPIGISSISEISL